MTAGSGRATVALASAGIQPVVALDLAPAMLGRLVDRVRRARLPVGAVAADMRRLPFGAERFGLVVIPFNAFAELVEATDRETALGEIRRVVQPRGLAIVTLHDPTRRRETLDGEVRQLGPFSVGDRRLDLLVRGRLVAPDLAESQQTYRLTRGDGCAVEERHQTVRFALPGAAALVEAARKAGLDSVTLFGDYDESPYVPGQSRFIIAVLTPAADARPVTGHARSRTT